MARTSQPINANWQFAQVASKDVPEIVGSCGDWQACEVPTSVHVELIKAGKIPDPFKGLKEWDVQWVGEADWEFKTTFKWTGSEKKGEEVDLVFEGLDTYCDITLNGHALGSTDNMFMSHRFACRDHLKEGDNDLRLVFRSAWYEAKREEAANGGKMALWNGDSCRLYSRKAQYGWGWDWGPILMTSGPWKPIYLETYSARFDDVRIDAKLDTSDYASAGLKLALSSTDAELAKTVKATLQDAQGHVVKEEKVGTSDGLEWTFKSGEVDAWWPIGYGSQPLYTLKLELLDKNDTVLDSTTRRVAFRTVKIVQEPLADAPGTSFLFEVNGVRIFCGGSNWIPADSFLTDIKPERYRAWVELMIKGNQNMLRVWGGGVYEHEELYNICDERGILVWQDFMFGCGLYPSYDSINASIKAEAEQAVKRLRDHPSVVIFAGNNEDYQVAESLGVMDYGDQSGDYMHTKFPARQIYEVILPEVVERLSDIFYHRSSPYGGESSSDKTVGDIHQWNVWHGTQEPWSNWDILAGRFVSEFGMQGYPDKRTVKAWQDDGDDSQNFPQSRVSVNHNKADGFERRLELYLMENFRHAFDMDSYIYYTQAMQAETLAAAYRLWRRNWKGRGKEYTAGALVWQLNDCWPCVSWGIADYHLRPKPSFFAIARELRPYTVGMTRKEIKTTKNETTSAFFEIKHELELWGCNSTLKPKEVKVELVSWELGKGELDRRTFDVVLEPNSSTEFWKGDVPGQPILKSLADDPKPIVVQARLTDPSSKEVLARYSNWPEPWKYLTFPKYNLTIEQSEESVTLKTDQPIKGIVLDVEGGDGPACEWEDQGIDLFPGDVQVVGVKGLDGRKVVARYIGDGSA